MKICSQCLLLFKDELKFCPDCDNVELEDELEYRNNQLINARDADREDF